MPDPISSTRRAHALESEPTQTDARSAPPARRIPHAPPSFDRDLATFIANTTPSSDEVLYLSMNHASAADEEAALRGVARVKSVPTTNESALDGFDLTTEGGCTAFVARHGLPDAVAKILHEASRPTTIALIARAWADGERGARIPSRVVVSGHSGTGTSIWGDASIELRDLQKLAGAMPRAAAQIEDLHFSACHSARNPGEDCIGWRAVFPNLLSVWGYNGAAPSPAGAHLARWAHATRGREGHVPLSPDLAAESVAVWSVRGGYRDASPPAATMRARADDAYRRLDAYARGDVPVTDPSSPRIVSDYRVLRALQAHHGVTRDEKKRAGDAAGVLLRVRYYEKNVRGEFVAAYARELERGYDALGMRAPDYASLSRRGALAAIATFEEKLGSANPVPAAARTLADRLRALATLDERIPDEWCQ